LHRGRLRLIGAPKLVTGTYQRLCNAPADQWDTLLSELSRVSSTDRDREGTKNDAGGSQEQASADDQLDPHLQPSSSLSYEARGIRIERVDVLNSNGEPANVLPMEQPFSLRFVYQAEQALSDLELACNIANHTGVRITGQQHPGPECGQGESFSLTFHFRAGLLPGLYFVGGGIWQRDQPKQFLHRVVDICALRITSDAPVRSFGFCDLQAASPSLE
jgi:lipopolysaccharide transport system ATP-binding protein